MALHTHDPAGQLSLFGLELASCQAKPTTGAPDKTPALRLIASQSEALVADAEKPPQDPDLLALNEQMLRRVRLF